MNSIDIATEVTRRQRQRLAEFHLLPKAAEASTTVPLGACPVGRVVPD